MPDPSSKNTGKLPTPDLARGGRGVPPIQGGKVEGGPDAGKHGEATSQGGGTPGGPLRNSPFGKGGCGGIAAALAVFTGVLTLLAIVGAVYIGLNWRSVSGSFVAGQLTESINSSSLPKGQRQQITHEIESIRDRFVDGDLTIDQVNRVGKIVFSDPVIEAGLLYWSKNQYLDGSGLSDPEKEQADRSLQRFMRGVFEGTIPPDRVAVVMAPVTTTNDEGVSHVKDSPSDAEVRSFVESARRSADDAKVPDQAYTVDVAARFKAEAEKAVSASPPPEAAPPSEAAPAEKAAEDAGAS